MTDDPRPPVNGGPYVQYTVKELLIKLDLQITELRAELRQRQSELETRIDSLERWQENLNGRLLVASGALGLLVVAANILIKVIWGH